MATPAPNRIEEEPAPGTPAGGAVGGGTAEEPTRLFAGLGLAEDTNERFHYLSRHQRSKRLSTAFDGPTLYGTGCGADGVFGKIGEGGVAIDTVDDMERLYAGFALDQAQRLGVHDHQRPRADHPGDVRRRRPNGVSGRMSRRSCAGRSRPTCSRKCRHKTR